MTQHLKLLEQRIERESREDCPAVLTKIGDGWRLIVADLSGAREIELQYLDGGEWVRFIGEVVEDLLLGGRFLEYRETQQ